MREQYNDFYGHIRTNIHLAFFNISSFQQNSPMFNNIWDISRQNNARQTNSIHKNSRQNNSRLDLSRQDN